MNQKDSSISITFGYGWLKKVLIAVINCILK